MKYFFCNSSAAHCHPPKSLAPSQVQHLEKNLRPEESEQLSTYFWPGAAAVFLRARFIFVKYEAAEEVGLWLHLRKGSLFEVNCMTSDRRLPEYLRTRIRCPLICPFFCQTADRNSKRHHVTSWPVHRPHPDLSLNLNSECPVCPGGTSWSQSEGPVLWRAGSLYLM